VSGETLSGGSFLRFTAWRATALIFFLALCFRIAIVERYAGQPIKDQMWTDSAGWNLAEGHGFTASPGPPYVPGLMRTPGFPVLLAVAYKIAGHSFKAAYIAQSLVDSLTAVLVFFVAAAYFPASVALAAGILYAVYPYSAWFCGVMTQDILLTFFVVLTLLLLVRALRRFDSSWAWLIVGVALGLATMVKPFLILYFSVILLSVLLARMSWSARLKALAPVVLATTLVIVPWGIRNYRLFHAFPPLAVGSTGENMEILIDEIRFGDAHILAQQTAPDSWSRDAYLRNVRDGAELLLWERDVVRRTSPELIRLWRPYLRVMAWHVPRLWVSTYAIFQRPIVARLALAVSVLVLIPGMFGMWLLRARWREFVPLYATIFVITVIYVPYTLEARYTLPARPAMIILDAVALIFVFQKVWPRRFAHPVEGALPAPHAGPR
jgi:4-amino-4-deoxy-L-arabinose transferase-like glycosyltransferase